MRWTKLWELCSRTQTGRGTEKNPGRWDQKDGMSEMHPSTYGILQDSLNDIRECKEEETKSEVEKDAEIP